MPIHSVTPQQALQWHNSSQAVIVDIRSAAQYAVQHIPGALNIPDLTMDSKIFADEATKVVVHCNRGGRAGRFCAAVMQQDDAIDIYHLEGGIEAWKEAGLAVEEQAI